MSSLQRKQKSWFYRVHNPRIKSRIKAQTCPKYEDRDTAVEVTNPVKTGKLLKKTLISRNNI